MDITAQVQYANNNTFNTIVEQVTAEQLNVNVLQTKFNNNPNAKTAKNLSNAKQNLKFLQESFLQTTEYKALKNKQDVENTKQFFIEMQTLVNAMVQLNNINFAK